MKKGQSYLETLTNRILSFISENKLPLASGIAAGLLAHMYMLTNLLPNHDCIESLFGKGATITSGRWGLELIKLLFPDVSMPWIYGIITILLISAAVCVMLLLLNIRSRAMQVIIPALVLGFPSLTGTFCFMFTSAPYAVSFLLSVLAVYELRRGSKCGVAAGILFIVLSLSLYQAYIAVTASLFVLIMIDECLKAEKDIKDILRFGIGALIYMLCAAALYYLITLLVLRFTGAEFNSYVTDNVNAGASVPGRIKMAYDAFRDVFVFRNFYLVPTEGSRLLHLAYLVVLLFSLLICALKRKKPLHAALCLLLVLLLPLSMNCMYIIMSGASIHTLVLYSFVLIYLLAAIACRELTEKREVILKTSLSLMLCVFSIINIYFANSCYLKLELELKNAESFYTAMLTRIYMTEGFDEDCGIALVGRQDNLLYTMDELDTELLMGPPRELINIYSRERFFELFLGTDISFADAQTLEAFEDDERVKIMNEYPYDGSVKRIDDYIVVKLG